MHNQRSEVQRSEVRDQTKPATITYPLTDLRPLIADLCFSKLRRGDLFDHVALDLIADLDVVEILQTDTALKAFAYFRGVVLESPQRRNVAFPDYHRVANQAGARIALHDAVAHHAPGSRP